MADRQFAIYSVDDESLNFYRYGRIPVVGTEFAGKHVTKVFENFNDHCWTTDAIAGRVTGVSVADGGIKPRKLCHWFNRFENLRAVDLEKLDTTYTTAAQGLFESSPVLSASRRKGLMSSTHSRPIPERSLAHFSPEIIRYPSGISISSSRAPGPSLNRVIISW